jgi:hypothetical protein
MVVMGARRPKRGGGGKVDGILGGQAIDSSLLPIVIIALRDEMADLGADKCLVVILTHTTAMYMLEGLVNPPIHCWWHQLCRMLEMMVRGVL